MWKLQKRKNSSNVWTDIPKIRFTSKKVAESYARRFTWAYQSNRRVYDRAVLA